jgi:hypothetical protein
MNTKILASIGVAIIVALILLWLGLFSNKQNENPAQIPEGITEEEHESHHTNLPQ